MTKLTNLLFEIISYDIPYDLQIKAEKDIKNLLNISLSKLNIKFASIISFSTNRRITLYIPQIEEIINPGVTKKKGPSVHAHTDIINNFLKANNVTMQQCYKEVTSKGEYYFFNKSTGILLLQDKLGDIIVNEVLNKVSFTRSMFWNETKIRWARPIINFVLMLGDKVIDFTFAGVKSTRTVQGHMFLSNKSVDLPHARDYFKVITDLRVILPYNTKSLIESNTMSLKAPELEPLRISREQIIVKAVEQFAEFHNHSIVANLQPNLLKELSYLTEYPVVLFGKIPVKYLVLPKELLVDTMVKNQRYINFFNKIDNSISEHFALVANIKSPDNGKEIIIGNQRVLNARLEDGLFFYNLDLKEDWVKKIDNLKCVNFFEGLGSLFDKQDRMSKLALKIFPNDNLSKICNFCKVDLLSKVVSEFPILQGVMGYYYAKNSNFREEDALAIKEHYMPLNSNSDLPTSLLGAKLAILDKIDTLISFFKINKFPTSSSDPFALRRAALGVIRICVVHELNFNLSNVIESNLLEFFSERLIVYLNSLGIKKDVTTAVLSKNNFNITEIVNKSIALNDVLKKNKDVINLFKRVFNIVNNESIKYSKIDPKLFCSMEENTLYHNLTKLQKKHMNFFKQDSTLKEPPILTLDQYKNYIQDVILLKPEIDSFLTNILIIDPLKPDITNNRLILLNKALTILQNIGKLELIS